MFTTPTEGNDEARQGKASNVQDWGPHMSFILKGSQILAFQLKGWLKSKTSIQEYRNAIQNSYWTQAWIIWYMFPVQCEVTKINYLTLLLVMTMPSECWFLVARKLYWGLQVTSSFSIWDFVLKGCFEISIFWRVKSHLKGIEDFNLEHWRQGKARQGKRKKRES